MTRIAAAKSLLSLAWGLVRYAGNVLRAEASPSEKHAAAERRWLEVCEARWAAFRRARDEWRGKA